MRISWKRAAVAVATLGTAVGMVSTAPAAHATPTAVIAAAGSDTTEEFVTNLFTVDTPNNFNIPAAPASPFTVPAGIGASTCPATTYDDAPLDAGETLAPNGSSSGVNALAADTTGCIDIARSSRAPAAGDAGKNLEFYSFAKDFIGWATPSPNAPATLSHVELQGIFRDCTITNWSQVGGRNAPILAAAPQSGSGSFASFRDKVLGGNYGACVLQAAAPPLIQEHSCESTPIRNNAQFVNLIVPYSAGQWALQEIRRANGPSQDLRNGCRIGGVEADPDGAGPGTTTCGQAADFHPLNYSAGSQNFSINATVVTNAVADANDPVGAVTGCGARNMFNVLKSTSVEYGQAATVAGLPSPLCNAGRTTTIVGAGFLPRATSGVSCNQIIVP